MEKIGLENLYRMVTGKSRGDNQVSAAFAQRIGGLAGENGANLLFGEVALAPNARKLHGARGGDGDHPVHPGVGAGFKQQRDVEHAHGRMGAAGLRPEARFGGAHQRVDDGFEPFEPGRIGQHQGAQGGAVEQACGEGFREGRAQGRDGGATRGLEPMDAGVGVEHRHMLAAEEARRSGFAHRDAAGEADHDHFGGGGSSKRGMSPAT